MAIRPFQLPQDIDLMNSLVMDGFQYPENPEWSVQEDEIQGMVDRIKGAKQLWPILRFLRVFVPIFRDILCGFIDEEDGKAAGLINYMRQRNAPEWYIANVTVLPAYRRRGIARKLVQATLDELRRREAQIVFLEVVVGNVPAFHLYKEMGFEEFTQSTGYYYQKETSKSAIPLPAGYNLRSFSPYDWKTHFNFAKRVTPAHITQYEPLTESRFKITWIVPLFGKLFAAAGGFHNELFAIYGPGEEVVGISQYTCRVREGGTNSASVSIDPMHPDLAEGILYHLFSEVQKASPGRRIELHFENWQPALLRCAEEMGCEKRFSSYRMGLRFDARYASVK